MSGEFDSIVTDERLLTASFDGTAQIWNGRTGSPEGEPMNHGDMVYDAIWSDDSSVVLTYGRSGSARLWNAASSRPLGERLSHRDRVDGASFCPAGPLSPPAHATARPGSGASPSRFAPRPGKPHSKRTSRPGWSWVTMTSRGCSMSRRGDRDATHSRRCEAVHGAEHLKPQDSLGSKTEHGRVTVGRGPGRSRSNRAIWGHPELRLRCDVEFILRTLWTNGLGRHLCLHRAFMTGKPGQGNPFDLLLNPSF